MTLDDFRQSLTATEPPAGLTPAPSGAVLGRYEEMDDSAVNRGCASWIAASISDGVPQCVARIGKV